LYITYSFKVFFDYKGTHEYLFYLKSFSIVPEFLIAKCFAKGSFSIYPLDP